MRRTCLSGLALVGCLLFASPASAQNARSNMFWSVSGHAHKSRSSDGDAIGMTIGLAMWHSGNFNPDGTPKPVEAKPTRQIDLIFNLRFGYEHDSGFMSEYLGGLQFTNTALFKWPVYIEILGGAQHFSGSTNGVLHADAGMIFGGTTGGMQFYVQGGVPLFLFSGNPEFGMEIGGGLRFGR